MTDRIENPTIADKLNTFFSRNSRVVLIVSSAVLLAIIVTVVAFTVSDRRGTEAAERIEAIQKDATALQMEILGAGPDAEPFTERATAMREAIADLIDDFPRSYAALRASLVLGELEWTLENWEAARDAYLAVAETENAGYLVPTALYSAGAASEELGDVEGAEELYLKVVEHSPNNIERPRALLSLGRLSEERGDPASALLFYNRLVDEHGDSNWTNLGRSRIIWLNSQEGNSGR